MMNYIEIATMIKKHMVNRSVVVLAALVLLNGCGISGHYQSTGPCKGFHKDQQACQKAADNASVIGNVSIGQTLKEVREVMGKGPERRKADSNAESWGYITNYRGYRFTTIVFTDGVVTEIK